MPAATLAFCAILLSPGRAPAQQIPPSADPEQLAAVIARTMNATKPNPSAAPFDQQFSSHANIVESHTVFRDANAFANMLAQRDRQQAGMTRYMCKAERRAFIRKGVVFHDEFIGPGDKSFAFIIDERACASLPTPAVADAATLQKLTGGVAQQLTTALSQKQLFPGSRFEKATAQGETVQVLNLIAAPAFVDFFKFKESEVRGKLQGLFCTRFDDAIRRGLKMEMIFKLEDGAPVLRFPIDSSVC